MKLENVERAANIGKELKVVNKNIDKLECAIGQKKVLHLFEHSDRSGVALDSMFTDGDYAMDFYKKANDSYLELLKEHRDNLIKEIKML